MSHGGNIYAVARKLGIREDKVIDFSASINPLGMPEAARKEALEALKALGNYPEPGADSFVKALSVRFGIEPQRLMAGNGSTELICLIARALRPRAVLVAAPTFSEYGRASRAAGSKVSHLKLERENGYRVLPERFISDMKDMDIAFLCNPNNPTGDVLSREAVMEIADGARKKKCMLVVDEAFMDFAPGESVLGTDNPYLIVLRSMTKFYAMAGLRLGFGCFPGRIAKRLREHKEPWSVNTLAGRAGAAALNDKDFGRKTLALMAEEKRHIEAGLNHLGLKYYPSRVNYYLIETGRARDVVSGLLKRRLAVRDCSNFSGLNGGFIRVAVKSRKENAMLLKGLSEVMGEKSGGGCRS